MSFEKHSNFNKLANFSEVKFGENKPVLEVELNEMQQIQNEARADIIRDTMPSGFVTLGDIDYDYCANNDNQIKLKTESIAYVNGYRITIPKGTIIEIGEEVKFGENKPVLEVELNEMQQIQNEARADIIRDTMPSGFVTLGEIDYDYCANNNNQIKLKTESIAYVNGYRITIPKDTVIEIGESDKEREDLVFLEVWKEAVNDIDTLTEYGGENNAVINNPIKDERYPVATSQRVALKYRIRHVADVDFKTYPEGIGIEETTWNQIPWDSYPNPIAPQGGRDTLYDLQPSIHHRYMFGKAMNVVRGISFSAYRNFPHIDLGLYISGNGTDLSKMDLKTLDGYVYAIPMFRLVRKPNVGLCTPFEYKKIHNQLDPKKFAHLVGQENVEKVHSVNVKGRTLHNLHHTKYGRGKYTLNASNSNWYSNYVSEDGRVAFFITKTEDCWWKTFI